MTRAQRLAGSDPNEDGTAIFDSIQEAIEVAAEGVTVVVRPGTYWENIDFTKEHHGHRIMETADAGICPSIDFIMSVVTFSLGESAPFSGLVVTVAAVTGR
jgi:hypothetical protein